MTEIMVSKRDGIAKGPDGTKYRVARGKTLADAAHPVVVAYPNDWQPIRVELSVPGGGSTATPDTAALDELRNEVAELEGMAELAEVRGAELLRLADGLADRGFALPAEDEREPGWLVDLALAALPAGNPEPAAEVPAPRAPRTAKPKPVPRG